MNPKQLAEYLQNAISETDTILQAVELFINDFCSRPLEGFDRDQDEEMLLFQAGGPYSWSPMYSLNCTRQFMFNDEDGEYLEMKQLRMDILFNPDSVKDKESINFWYGGEGASTFIEKIKNTLAFQVCEDLTPVQVEIALCDA